MIGRDSCFRCWVLVEAWDVHVWQESKPVLLSLKIKVNLWQVCRNSCMFPQTTFLGNILGKANNKVTTRQKEKYPQRVKMPSLFFHDSILFVGLQFCLFQSRVKIIHLLSSFVIFSFNIDTKTSGLDFKTKHQQAWSSLTNHHSFKLCYFVLRIIVLNGNNGLLFQAFGKVLAFEPAAYLNDLWNPCVDS